MVELINKLSKFLSWSFGTQGFSSNVAQPQNNKLLYKAYCSLSARQPSYYVKHDANHYYGHCRVEGKTTLARAIIAALGHSGEVPSPTFAIIETYDPPQVRLPLVHADFYRLNDPAEAEELGLDHYREGAVLLAEWPEQAGGFGHEPGCLAIRLESADSARIAIVEPGPDWLGRLP